MDSLFSRLQCGNISLCRSIHPLEKGGCAPKETGDILRRYRSEKPRSRYPETKRGHVGLRQGNPGALRDFQPPLQTRASEHSQDRGSPIQSIQGSR